VFRAKIGKLLSHLLTVILSVRSPESSSSLHEMCFLLQLTMIVNVTFARLRTGMLAMLLQSIMELSDEEIILDYFKSNQMQKGSAALGSLRQTGAMDHDTFSGTNPEAMETTLRFLRSKYGSVSPGYLNSIGFDEIWRQRLLAVIKRASSRL
jgi:hypothetical protein